jgi:hypothetical protein
MCEPIGIIEAIEAIEPIEAIEAIESIDSISDSTDLRLRLISGLEVLAGWSDTASQVEKNAMHKALFAMADCSVFGTYEILDDCERPREFYIMVKGELVVKIRIHDFETFGIVYLGSLGDAPNLDLDGSQAA